VSRRGRLRVMACDEMRVECCRATTCDKYKSNASIISSVLSKVVFVIGSSLNNWLRPVDSCSADTHSSNTLASTTAIDTITGENRYASTTTAN
jgi:hypothetical protein